MSVTAIPTAPAGRGGKDIGFAVGIVLILCLFFLPVPATMIDFGLALSIALSVLILMVGLWIQKPLEFSAFPTVLLVATILRLALNISTTRLILSRGAEGPTSAGYIIGGFAHLVMGGDFLIGIIVFLILVTINFLVITKGATRIAEVGARFTLDAIPGKQMAIDADLSAGLIDEKVAQAPQARARGRERLLRLDGRRVEIRARRRDRRPHHSRRQHLRRHRHRRHAARPEPLRRGRHLHQALGRRRPRHPDPGADHFARRGPARRQGRHARLGRQGGHRSAQRLSECALSRGPPDGDRSASSPGLPFLPFATLGGLMAFVGIAIPRRIAKDRLEEAAREAAKDEKAKAEARASIKEQLKSFEIELCLSKELNAALILSREEMASRIAKMRRKFARQYGFVVPEIRLSDDIKASAEDLSDQDPWDARSQRRSCGSKSIWSSSATARRPICPATKCASRPSASGRSRSPRRIVKEARREGFKTIDPVSVLLTHLSEVIHNNLAQLLSYKDMRALMDRLEPEYKRLLDDICPSQISQSGLLATLKLLLAERVSIRHLNLILEAVAEIAPHVRRPEGIVEHVRVRLAQQICGDLLDSGALSVLRLGNRWDLVFHQSLKRDAKGEVIEFDIDPRLMEQFAAEASTAIRKRMDRASPVRARHHRRDAALCAHDHRAHVPDAARSVPARGRARLRGEVAGDDLVTGYPRNSRRDEAGLASSPRQPARPQ